MILVIMVIMVIDTPCAFHFIQTLNYVNYINDWYTQVHIFYGCNLV